MSSKPAEAAASPLKINTASDPNAITPTLILSPNDMYFMEKMKHPHSEYSHGNNPWEHNIARKRRDLEFNFGVGPGAVVNSPHTLLLSRTTDSGSFSPKRQRPKDKIGQIEDLCSSIKKSDQKIKGLMKKIEKQNKTLSNLAEKYGK